MIQRGIVLVSVLSNVGELFDLDYACTGTVLDLLLC